VDECKPLVGGPGDLLFIPCGMPHTVENRGESLALGWGPGPAPPRRRSLKNVTAWHSARETGVEKVLGGQFARRRVNSGCSLVARSRAKLLLRPMFREDPFSRDTVVVDTTHLRKINFLLSPTTVRMFGAIYVRPCCEVVPVGRRHGGRRAGRGGRVTYYADLETALIVHL